MPNDKPAPKLVEHNLMVILTQYLDGDEDDYGLRRRALNAVELLARRVEIALKIFQQYHVSLDVLSGNPREQIQAIYDAWRKDMSLSYQPAIESPEEMVMGSPVLNLRIEGRINAMLVIDWMMMEGLWFSCYRPAGSDTQNVRILTVRDNDLPRIVEYCKQRNIEVE